MMDIEETTSGLVFEPALVDQKDVYKRQEGKQRDADYRTGECLSDVYQSRIL